MGITFSYRRVNQSEAQKILEGNSSLLAKWFGPDFREDDGGGHDRWFEWLQESEQYLDILKSWQAVHFLLTGEVCSQGKSHIEGPLRNVVMGGTPTNIETIYGVAYYLTSAEVAQVAAALEPLTTEVVSPLYNANAFRQANVYPLRERWSNDGSQHGLQRFIHDYERLRAFFLSAAGENQAMFLTAD